MHANLSGGLRRRLRTGASLAALSLLAAPLGIPLAPPSRAADATVEKDVTQTLDPAAYGVKAGETLFLRADLTVTDADAFQTDLAGVTLDNAGTITHTAPLSTYVAVHFLGDGVLRNSGTITSDGDAVVFEANGRLENSGSIDGGFTGVEMKFGEVVNSGTVRGDTGGVSILGGYILNQVGAEISGTEDFADAIYHIGYLNDLPLDIVNRGYIQSAKAIGIALDNGTVVNARGSGEKDGVIYGGLLGITVSGLSASVTNGGVIIGQEVSGVSFSQGGYLHNLTGGVIMGGKSGVAIGAEADGQASQVINEGTISGGTEGIKVYNGSFVPTAHVENRGVIRGDENAIKFNSADDLLILDTGSELQGAAIPDGGGLATGRYEAGLVYGGDGRDTLILRGRGSEDAEFFNFEVLKVESGADWRLSGTLVVSETVKVEGRLAIDGGLFSQEFSEDVPLERRLTVRDGGALGGEGALLINVTFEKGSSLAQRIGDGSADLLTVEGGTVTVEPGAAVEVTLDGTVSEGETFTLLQAPVIEGDFADFSRATLRTGFAIETGPTEVTATAELRTFTEAAITGNQRAVAAVLDRNEAAGGADFAALVAAVDAAGGALDVAALDQVSGDVHATTASTGLMAARSFLEGLAGHGEALSSGAQVAGLGQVAALTQSAAGPLPAFMPKSGRAAAWAALDGTFGSLEDANAGDTDYDLFGVTFGGDYAVGPSLLLGAAVGFAAGSSESDDRGASADSTALRLAGYGRWYGGALSVTAAAGASIGSLESERATPLGTASGETDATAFGFAVEGRYAWDLRGVTLSPLAGLSFTTLTQDAFEESGAGTANLSVGEATADSFRASLGAVVAKSFKNGGATLTPEARLVYRHEFADGFGEVSNSFLADATKTGFTVIGAEPATHLVEIGAGITAELKNGMSLFGDAAFALGDGQNETNLLAGLRMSF